MTKPKTLIATAVLTVMCQAVTVGAQDAQFPYVDDLTNPGKIVIICLMYWGRVGLMTFFYSLIKHEKRTEIHYPREDTPIG